VGVEHIFFPTIPEISGAPARHDAGALLPNVPDIRRKLSVVSFGLMIRDGDAKEQRLS
jgi:hypothetical protein